MSDIIPGCRERTNFIQINLLINPHAATAGHLSTARCLFHDVSPIVSILDHH